MSDGEVTPDHEPWRYKTLSACADDISGNVTAKQVAPIYVPWPHVLRRAFFASIDQDAAGGSNSCKLERALPDAAASTLSTEQWGDSSGKPTKREFDPLTESDREVSNAVGAIYYLEIDTDNAGDAMVQPALTLMVSPIPPGPA
jgi:hypothetical protein